MPDAIMATGLSAPERACLFQLEQQMVRQKGFINREAFTDEQDAVFNAWQQAGYISLDAGELKHLPQQEVNQRQLTHSCHLHQELWIAASCLRRLYACDL